MRTVRRIGLTLALLCAAVAASAAGASAHADRAQLCTAFGKTFLHRYNAEPGPTRILSICCALRSVRTGNSQCKMKVTEVGHGEGIYGCGIATVAPNFVILANRPLARQACRRLGGVASLPA
jgi:hypothetical protein